MTQKRTSAGSRPLAGPPGASTDVRVVIVTMDSHLASAAHRAMRGLSQVMPGLHLVVHAAAEWGGDPSALARCKADIARGDIVVATMLFMEEHFLPVLVSLGASVDHNEATTFPIEGYTYGSFTKRSVAFG